MRIAAAFIAVPVFELALYLGLSLLGGSRKRYVFFLLPLPLHVVYVAMAVVVGLVFGFRGITWLLGHLFFTHFEHERRLGTTFGLWAALMGAAYVLYRVVTQTA